MRTLDHKIFYSNLRNQVLAVWILPFLFIATAITGVSQSCPSNIRDLRLDSPLTEKKNCPRGTGIQECWMLCEYVGSGNTVEARLQFKWAVSAPNPDAVTRYACTLAPQIESGQTHPNRQAVVWWTITQPAMADPIMAAGLRVLEEIGPLAIACPGRSAPPAPRRPIGVTSNQDNRFPEMDPSCRSNLPMGKIRSPKGNVEVYSYAFDKWKGPITSEFPVFRCDRVRTTGRDSTATVFIYTPSGAEDRIDMGGDTILEIPGPPENYNENEPPKSEGFFADLMKGSIRWFSSEQRPERRYRSPFNVRTPTIVTARRGTDFVISHDPVSQKDYIFLNSGGLEISASGESMLLKAGQQVFTENKKLSTVSTLRPDVWSSLITGKMVANQSLFTDSRLSEKETGKNEKAAVSSEGNEKSGQAEVRPNTGQIRISFQGRQYFTIYERSAHEGVPIDVYFFPITAPGGSQAEQDGQKLWGRFVRYPSVGTEPNRSLQWWYVNWIFRNGRWESVSQSGLPFEVQNRPN